MKDYNDDVVVDVPAISEGDNLIKMADNAEKRVNAIKRIKNAALSVTNKNDWVKQGDKPYLNVSGAEKIARLFGISWRIEDLGCETEEDGHFSYVYKGYFVLGGAEIEVLGTRSSKDPFFSRSKGSSVPPSEINRNNVKKAAWTNCIGNGITRVLGIRNMTWEDLRNVGIDDRSVESIEYSKEEMSEESKGQKEQIRSMVLEMSGGDDKEAKVLLKAISSFHDKSGKFVEGKQSVNSLTEKQVPAVYGKVKKEYENWKSGEGSSPVENGEDSSDQDGSEQGTIV